MIKRGMHYQHTNALMWQIFLYNQVIKILLGEKLSGDVEV